MQPWSPPALSPPFSIAFGEQRAQAGSQTGQEGTEGQPDPGSFAGPSLRRLAALLHHKHGPGQCGTDLVCQDQNKGIS